MQEPWVQFLGWEDPLEKEMAIHSSTLAWKIAWTEEPDKPQSMGSQRVGHDWATSLHFTSLHSLVAWASHCSGSSCGKAQALGTQASVIVAHGLSCSKTCGVFPDQRSNPFPLHWQADSFPLYHQGSLVLFYILRLNSTLYIVGTQQILAEWWSGLGTVPEGRETSDLLCWGPYCLSYPSRVDFIAGFIQMMTG